MSNTASPAEPVRELAALIDGLSQPAAYRHPVEQVDVRQTHVSVVFLAGPFAYKLKKPVKLEFLDFSTLDNRRFFCEQELQLNRRLAPEVYLGVVPVVRTARGIQLEGAGEVIEWAVKMQRLPDEATLLERLQRGEVEIELVEALARKIAGFHQTAATSARIATFGNFEAVCRNVHGIFDQGATQVGTVVSRRVFDRLQTLAVETLTRLRSLIEARAARGMPRDTHGDLHLDHVYCFPDRPPPSDLVIVDCIEFNEEFRYADPVADMAFPVMDFAFHGRRDLACAFAEAYFRAAGDEEGRALLPLYTAYRALVRGKVEGLLLQEEEVPEPERAAALTRARAHWLLALTELEQPGAAASFSSNSGEGTRTSSSKATRPRTPTLLYAIKGATRSQKALSTRRTTMFRKLLLPVDLSDRHQPALDLARELAGPQGEVVLLHVIEVIPGLSLEEERPFYQRLEEAAQKHLERLSSTLAAQRISSHVEMRYGKRVAEIVRYASESGTDLVVLTTPPFVPKEPTAGWGSMSYKVGLLLPCPVLLVK